LIDRPYIWFGGKARCAHTVWAALGDVDNYVEPFYGGGAVHLMRPHAPRVETINDADGFVANFWRAVQAAPDEVAAVLDQPVNEVDLEARHRWLCCASTAAEVRASAWATPAARERLAGWLDEHGDKAGFLARMKEDPGHYDATRAGWWCWGLCAWIGRGWCEGEWWPGQPGASHGQGICDGANKRPHLGRSHGVHRKLPHFGGSRGVCAPSRAARVEWMRQLADRLRHVRVCCGDWARVVTDGATDHGSTVGVFLDPPYSAEAGRDNNIYRCEDLTVAHDVRAWCLQRTGQPRYRIVLAGYAGEGHEELERAGWRVVAWKAGGGFASFAKGANACKANAHRERLWLSPSCLPGAGEAVTAPLWAAARAPA
jgi:hypothetical protein